MSRERNKTAFQSTVVKQEPRCHKLSLQSHSSPERGALNARFDCALVLSPGFRHQVGFSFLQTSPLCCLLLFGELPAYFLTDHLLQDTQKATDEGKFCLSPEDRRRFAVSATNQLLHSLANSDTVRTLSKNTYRRHMLYCETAHLSRSMLIT